MTAELARELRWWKENIANLPTRIIPMDYERNNLVYTDASGGGGISIGTIIILHSEPHRKHPAYSGKAPSWLEDKNIYTLEIYAACLGAFHLSTLNGTGPALFFIDNDAATSALIRGTSDDETARLLIDIFWRTCTRSRITPWIERVCSKNNPADEPSRGPIPENSICKEFDFKECPFLLNEQAAKRFAGRI